MQFYRRLFKILDWLQKDASDTRLAIAISLGFCLALVPFSTLHGALLLGLLLLLRVNLCAAVSSFAVFSVLAYPLDSEFHWLGYAVLTWAPLHRLWAGLYHIELFPFTRFNNTLVMGRSLVAFLLAGPLYFAVKSTLRGHRKLFITWFQQSPAWDTWASTRLYRLYVSYHEIRR